MNMDQATARIEALIDGLTGAIMNTLEVSAERITLAADVARVKQRMAAFSAVLESVAAQKKAVAELMAEADGPAEMLYRTQLDMLTAQEVAVLERSGIPRQQAVLAIDSADAEPGTVAVKPHKRSKPKKHAKAV